MCTPSWIFSPPNRSPTVHCHIYLSPVLCALVQELFKQEKFLIGLLWAMYLSFGPSSLKGNHSHEAHLNSLVRVWSHSSYLFLHKKKGTYILLATPLGSGNCFIRRCHLRQEEWSRTVTRRECDARTKSPSNRS